MPKHHTTSSPRRQLNAHSARGRHNHTSRGEHPAAIRIYREIREELRRRHGAELSSARVHQICLEAERKLAGALSESC